VLEYVSGNNASFFTTNASVDLHTGNLTFSYRDVDRSNIIQTSTWLVKIVDPRDGSVSVSANSSVSSSGSGGSDRESGGAEQILRARDTVGVQELATRRSGGVRRADHKAMSNITTLTINVHPRRCTFPNSELFENDCRCVANFYKSALTTCTNCPSRTASPAGSTRLAQCIAVNPTPNCTANQQLLNNTCVCAANSFLSSGTCTACPSGGTSPLNTTSVTGCTCPANAQLRGTTCVCRKGFYGIGSQCTACVSPATSRSGSTTIDDCTVPYGRIKFALRLNGLTPADARDRQPQLQQLFADLAGSGTLAENVFLTFTAGRRQSATNTDVEIEAETSGSANSINGAITDAINSGTLLRTLSAAGFDAEVTSKPELLVTAGQEEGGLSGGAIAGIVIGTLAGVGILGGAGYYVATTQSGKGGGRGRGGEYQQQSNYHPPPSPQHDNVAPPGSQRGDLVYQSAPPHDAAEEEQQHGDSEPPQDPPQDPDGLYPTPMGYTDVTPPASGNFAIPVPHRRASQAEPVLASSGAATTQII